MKTQVAPFRFSRLTFALLMLLLRWPAMSASPASALVGRWSLDEGFQIVAFEFRSDGRYQIDTRSTDPNLDFAFSDRGRYTVDGNLLVLAPDLIRRGRRSLASAGTEEHAFRPDGHYAALHTTAFLEGLVRGRFEMGPRRIGLSPAGSPVRRPR